MRAAPKNRLSEQPAGQRIQVEVGGEVLADSEDVIELEEEGCRSLPLSPVSGRFSAA
jgi:uncharacterized protein (DUF427 family)